MRKNDRKGQRKRGWKELIFASGLSLIIVVAAGLIGAAVELKGGAALSTLRYGTCVALWLSAAAGGTVFCHRSKAPLLDGFAYGLMVCAVCLAVGLAMGGKILGIGAIARTVSALAGGGLAGVVVQGSTKSKKYRHVQNRQKV